MIRVTTETKAELQTERGRVVGFVKSSEPGKISIAVPADRAVMTPAQARQLAAWLNEEADRGGRLTAADRTDEGWRRAEQERRDAIRTALNADRVTFAGRTYTRRG
ncbi:hypothetical protein SEA_EURATIS_40 [Streptomyces phage Euratis]|uniref:Uncharacterized protein n=1 Tax=Streptomyces phage Euratis TaxID=2510569 RepID=A0A411B107_9CAUD|nr:hypothetical protein SEA_EURATIS_40 [Streptomyces phage Euratis]